MPQFDSVWINSLCELGPRPLVATGWFRLLLAGHFQPGNLEDTSETIGKMLWKPDNTTGIMIESITRWVPELTEKRPAVIIKRNGWRRLRLGIGDKMFGPGDPAGQEFFANAWQGSHTLFCIAGKGAETEKLAAEVYREMNEFGPAIRATLDLLRFEVTEVGELMLLEEARQNFVVPVVVAYAFVESWQLQDSSPPLTGIDLALMEP